ncbi:transposase [Janthinobacterium sp. TB1-E2]|uniref:Transposase n=1 Tax=Janthinobacterium aestuarii TaxID=2985511 RepID=A0ABZ2GKG3_9BURK
MARTARLFLPGMPLHVVQRGADRQACFLDADDYLRYLSYLSQALQANPCRIHAYVLMTNHVHLLLSADTSTIPSGLMKSLAQYFNWRYGRTGSIWDGRYKSCLVQDELYLLVCQRYIELNPVRAGMVDLPGAYRWSSYRCNACGELDSLVTAHPLYWRLGRSQVEAQAAYRELFQRDWSLRDLSQLRASINAEFALGDQDFLRHVAERGDQPQA